MRRKKKSFIIRRPCDKYYFRVDIYEKYDDLVPTIPFADKRDVVAYFARTLECGNQLGEIVFCRRYFTAEYISHELYHAADFYVATVRKNKYQKHYPLEEKIAYCLGDLMKSIISACKKKGIEIKK